ncbi:MAG: orotidine 5'-phosphate decarboxylase [Acidilobaceae archaeon]|nr:orotidine 5'-phosphate decarboxylase [Acidilobaceae archaeon]MCX8165253.1 orotidine 5'-phosphate decarboxylase [Acidilobaceae archaeon]MDW7973679.1 orotidine 5'-phosphate decarboxylase / HUMPS family protein [Sulfolobales archaeon]
MSRLIVAFDPEGEPLRYWVGLAGELCREIWGVKVGLPFLLRYGSSSLREIRGACDKSLIADLKLADIEPVMLSSVSALRGLVDAVIAHAFVGYAGAIEGLRRGAEEMGVKLILVASMSHSGSEEVIDPAFERVLEVIRRAEPWGIVAPATRPAVIAAIRQRGFTQKILSPGVGAQGALPGSALRAGADYEIVGRYITRSKDPLATARAINLQHQLVLGSSGGAG